MAIDNGFTQKVHQLLELIATSRFLTWLTISVIAPLDRKLLAISKGRLSMTGSSTVLLITKGAKSGVERHVSLPGLSCDEKIILLASKGGAPTHPAWYHNLVKYPDVEIVNKGERKPYRAHTAEGEERQQMWQFLLDEWSGFAAYEKKAAPRILPIVVLTPAA